jgi:hypothetical protein
VTTLSARASAFWLAWKWVLLLLVLLGLSVWLNVHQWKQAITAPLRAEVATKDQALDTAVDLLQDGRKSEQRLMAAMDTASGQLEGAARDYRQAAKNRPLDPGCAPGRGRVDSVNRMLGAPSDAQEIPR